MNKLTLSDLTNATAEELISLINASKKAHLSEDVVKKNVVDCLNKYRVRLLQHNSRELL